MIRRLLLLCCVAPALLAGCGGGGSAPADTPQAPAVLQGGVALLAGHLGGLGNIDGTGDEARFDDLAGITSDAAGNLYVTGDATIRRITPQRVVTTLAGVAGSPGLVDGTGTSARLAPARLVADPQGTVYFTQLAAVRKLTPAGVVSTIAGTDAASDTQVDGPVAVARFQQLGAIALDPAGNVYVVDNNVIRRISTAGEVTTLAGRPGPLVGYQDGTGANAMFCARDMVADAAGNLYLADDCNLALRKVTPAGVVTTVARRSGSAFVFQGPKAVALAGDGGWYVVDADDSLLKVSPAGEVSTILPPVPPVGSASVWSVQGITMATDGNLFVTNRATGVVERVTAAGSWSEWAGRSSSLQPVEGSGAAASLAFPHGVAGDVQGHAYVSDSDGSTLRKVAPDGSTSTLVSGAAGGFRRLMGLDVDAAGFIYAADQYNNAIRKISPTGTVRTLAGLAAPDSGGFMDGTADRARFQLPEDVAVTGNGTVYVADTANQVVRKITSDGVVTTLAGAAGQKGSADGSGSAARFDDPQHVAVGAGGTLYVSDRNGLRRVTADGVVTTVAPGGDMVWFTTDAAGNAYGTQRQNGTALYRLTPAGDLAVVAGVPGSVGVRTGALPGSLGLITDAAVLPPLHDTVGTRIQVLTEASVVVVTLPE